MLDFIKHCFILYTISSAFHMAPVWYKAQKLLNKERNESSVRLRYVLKVTSLGSGLAQSGIKDFCLSVSYSFQICSFLEFILHNPQELKIWWTHIQQRSHLMLRNWLKSSFNFEREQFPFGAKMCRQFIWVLPFNGLRQSLSGDSCITLTFQRMGLHNVL